MLLWSDIVATATATVPLVTRPGVRCETDGRERRAVEGRRLKVQGGMRSDQDGCALCIGLTAMRLDGRRGGGPRQMEAHQRIK